MAGRPLDPRNDASQTATRVLLARLDIAQIWFQSVHGRTYACHA
jgi:hypothetical protein